MAFTSAAFSYPVGLPFTMAVFPSLVRVYGGKLEIGRGLKNDPGSYCLNASGGWPIQRSAARRRAMVITCFAQHVAPLTMGQVGPTLWESRDGISALSA